MDYARRKDEKRFERKSIILMRGLLNREVSDAENNSRDK